MRGSSSTAVQSGHALRYHRLHLSWTSGSIAVSGRDDSQVDGPLLFLQWSTCRRGHGGSLNAISFQGPGRFQANARATSSWHRQGSVTTASDTAVPAHSIVTLPANRVADAGCWQG